MQAPNHISEKNFEGSIGNEASASPPNGTREYGTALSANDPGDKFLSAVLDWSARKKYQANLRSQGYPMPRRTPWTNPDTTFPFWV